MERGEIIMIGEDKICRFLSKIIQEEKKINLQNLKKKIKEYFKNELTEEDTAISGTRPGEQMIDQRVRNINCHKNFPKNVIYINEIFYDIDYYNELHKKKE